MKPTLLPIFALCALALGGCYPYPPPPPPVVVVPGRPAPPPPVIYRPGTVVRVLPGRHRVIYRGGVAYYVHGGTWFRPHPRGYVVVRPL